MKKISKLILACASTLVLFVACDFNASVRLPGNDKEEDSSKEEEVESGVDFTNYTDYALVVKNNAQKNMVLFKGEPSQGNILGGVKAGSTTGLKKNPSIFGKSTDYVVYAVTEDSYVENKRRNKDTP